MNKQYVIKLLKIMLRLMKL